MALPDGRALSASYDNTLRLWDLAQGKPIGGLFSDSPISCLTVFETGVGACGHVNGQVTVFRVGPNNLGLDLESNANTVRVGLQQQ